MNPKVSVNLCCYNSEKYLRETLDSIVNQTFKDWELIIINDGSSDSTESIIHEYIKQGYPTIYHYQENKGLGYSRNEALKRSQGEFIAFIDHDDLWMPEKLEKQVPLFDNPKVGLVYCDCYRIDMKGKIIGLFSDDIYFPRGLALNKLIEDGAISALSSLVIRKSAFEKVGFFNHNYNICEEFDLAIRIAEYFDFDYSELSLAKYRHHEGNISKNVDESIGELLKIIDGFIDRRPDLVSNAKTAIEYARYKFHAKLAIYNFMKGEILTSFKDALEALSNINYNPALIAKGVYVNLYKRRIKRIIKGRFYKNSIF